MSDESGGESGTEPSSLIQLHRIQRSAVDGTCLDRPATSCALKDSDSAVSQKSAASAWVSIVQSEVGRAAQVSTNPAAICSSLSMD